MIDNPTTVAVLLEQMHDHLPIPAFPTKEIVRTLRRGGVKVSIEHALSVKHVFYAGDEAGIVCDVTPGRNAKTVVLGSLTHLRVAPDHPLAAPIVGYQLEEFGDSAWPTKHRRANAGALHRKRTCWWTPTSIDYV